MREGTGTIVHVNGDEFTGEWFQDKPHDRGVYKSAKDGSTYSGDWRDGKRHGSGILELVDGSPCRDEWFRGVLAVRFMPARDSSRPGSPAF